MSSACLLRVCGVALLVAGCGGAVAPAGSRAATEPTPTVTIPVPVLSSRPPRVAKPDVRIELALYHRFVTLRVAPQRFRRMELATLGAMLPPAIDKALREEAKAPDDLRKLANDAREARLRLWECRQSPGKRAADLDCPPLPSLEKEVERSKTRFELAAEAAVKKNGATAATFEKAASDPAVNRAAIFLALARIHELGRDLADLSSDEDLPTPSFDFGEIPPTSGVRSAGAAAAYEEAKKAASPNSDLALHARIGALAHAWAAGDIAAVVKELEALSRTAPADLLVQIRYLVGVLRAAGPNADYAKSSEALRGALSAPATLDGPSRTDVLLALMLAEYRAGRFAAALDAAVRAMLEEQAGRRAASVAWALRGSTISPRGVERIAADCVERLGDDKANLSAATPEAAATIHARLAIRSLYRGDSARAKRYADAVLARAPESVAAGDALGVLAAVARAEGKSANVAELERRKEELTKARRGRTSDIFATFGIIGLLGTSKSVEDEESASLDRPSSVDHQAPEIEASPSPPAAQRNVESLVRLCLEPSHWRFERRARASSAGKGDAAAPSSRLEIDATVYDDGSTDVTARATAGAPLDPIVECLRASGPRAMSGSPTGVHAVVDVSQVQTPEWLAKSNVLGAIGGSSAGDMFRGPSKSKP